ncbi:myomegalin-like isoform X2 [Salvelinus fontinalis]|uniref:myomegalin-like isoform X2 n=1 Tax=Salvelinus fontinalis TaxID=8038 RepID=UPI0024859209|nr:myomegalin-like isoform X2 [Salvelinus fontinalis]
MLDVKMKEVCRICARELCGNQRRWIFHPASKLNLQVLLSHALGRELTRDGRGEFACSKCTFMLDRMYRFDTVIARVEALSLERLHKLLQEKDRLRQCIGGLYRKNNPQDQTLDQTGMGMRLGGTGEGETEGAGRSEGDSSVVDLSALQEARYSALLQDDLAYSVYESWADHEDQQSPAPDPQHHTQHHHPQCTGLEALSGHRSRRCRGCAALRVADSDYEAVCKVPRWVGRRSTSCGPSTRYSGSTMGGEETSTGSESTPVPSESPPMEPESDRTLCDGDPERMTLSPGTSVESLDTAVDVARPCATHREEEERERGEKDPGRVQRRGPHLQWDVAPRDKSVSGLTLELALSLVRNWEYRPLKSPQGSRLPILVKPKLEMGLPQSLRTPDYELYSHPAIPDLVTPSSQQELQTELSAMEEQWLDDYVQCGPFRFQQRLLDEQQGKLSQYESAAGHCVSELQKAQLQVHSLQAKISESEARNQKLQVRLGDMECELRLVREETQRQERNGLNLTDTINSKDTEAAELYRVIEEQNDMLCSLKDLANRNQVQTRQVSGAESVRGQGKVLALQGSLFQAQLELQAGQRAQRQAIRKEEDLTRALIRLEQDLQGAMEHRHSTDRHNQDLHLALEKVRSELQQRKEQLNEKEGERLREEEDMEKTIRELRISLQSKEQLVQEYTELLDQQQGPKLLSKLKERIKERDRALERAVDEKFHCVEEKEGEIRRLQLLLREKKRDLERQRCVLSNNEETIMSLEVLVRGKGLEQEQVCEAWRSVQRHHADSEERHSRSLRERDALISQLQNALHTRTKEAEDLTGALLGKVKAGPSEVVEELKARLSLKEKLFQDLLSDRSRQAQEHHTLVQDLLDSISTRDQYIHDSAGRLGEVMSEQTVRLQELRRQLTSGSQAYGSQLDLQGPGLQGPDLQGTSQNFQALQEELRLALMREREAQAEITALRTMAGQTDRPVNRQAEFGEFSSEEEDDVNSDYADSMEEEESKLTAQTLATMQDPVGEGQGLVEVKQLVQQKRVVERELMEVKQLVQQKRVVERELQELKVQLEKAGFSSLAQMRKALFSLRMENKELKSHQTERQPETDLRHEQILQEEEEDEEEVDEEEEEEELCGSELWESWDDECPSQGKCCAPRPTLRDPGLGRRHCTRPVSLDPGAMLSHSTQDEDDDEEEAGREAGGRRHSATETVVVEQAVCLQLESKELKERLMVSEATVQAQAEQLKDYRDLLTETSVQQDSKQVQVDLQDMGYETCGRSENEANREETSSPEFDDLEMCTSLECGGSRWSGTVHPGKAGPPTSTSEADNMTSLQRLVEDLRSQLSRSQTVIQSLQGRLHSLSISSELSIGPSIPRKVNWGVQFQAKPSQSGPEEDEGWESSGGGLGPSPHHPKPDKDLQELVSRVGALEDQLRKGKETPRPTEEGKATSWPGPEKFNTLIQAQARELSHLRQRMREGRGVCHILTQHLGDTTKAFEELLRANDIDYYMGQSFREQLAQSSALAQRVGTKISGRDHPEIPDDKTGTELLAIRLSKELQQKDNVIDSLRAKLTQHQPRSDTPCSSHALSDTTDQSDQISFVSDEQGSTNEDLEPCSDIDVASEYGQEARHASTRASTDSHCNSVPMSRHPSIPPSTSSFHGHQSSISCPSLQRSADTQTQTDLYSGPVSSSLPTQPQPQSQPQPQPQPQSQPQPHPRYHSDLSSQRVPLSFNLQTATLRPRYHGSRPGAFSLAEVHQELQMLQRQLGETERFSVPSVKPFGGFPMSAHPHPQTDPSSYMPQPLSYHTFHPAGLNASLNASPAMKAGASLLESSAMWDMAYGARSMRVGTANLSSGSSGYQSGTSLTGSDLIKEHLSEIGSLRQRLGDSIQTNDLLRQQLEEGLVDQARGAPTNIYIQGLDSISQLSSEIRFLKVENLSLQDRLQQASRDGSKEGEQLREAVLLGRARVKDAELETERWAEQGRRLYTQTQAQTLEITQLKQDRQSNQETINRLQHDVNVKQQQLCESRSLAHSLQYDLQIYHRECGIPKNTNTSEGSHSGESASFDPRDLHVQLGQQLTSGTRPPGARIQLFHDPALSTPVRDTGLFSPASPLSLTLEHRKVDFSLEGQAPDGPFANRNGHHVVGHVDDFSALQQKILEGCVLIGKMEAALRATANHALLELSLDKPVDPGCVRSMLTCSTTLRKILEDASSLLRMFWRAALPNSEGSTQSTKTELSLKEVHTMRQRISEQEEALKDAMERLKSSNRTKDSIEHFIVSQLSRTKDVLKKARTNLEENEQRMSSLGLTSFPSSSSSSSSHPWVGKGENPRGFCELTQSAGWGIVKPQIQAP